MVKGQSVEEHFSESQDITLFIEIDRPFFIVIKFSLNVNLEIRDILLVCADQGDPFLLVNREFVFLGFRVMDVVLIVAPVLDIDVVSGIPEIG